MWASSRARTWCPTCGGWPTTSMSRSRNFLNVRSRRAGESVPCAGKASPRGGLSRTVLGKSFSVSLAAKALDTVVNPSHGSAPDRLRDAVSRKAVLVTGASFGIGEATARKLAAAGGTVRLAERSQNKLDDLVRDIDAGGGHAV